MSHDAVALERGRDLLHTFGWPDVEFDLRELAAQIIGEGC